MAEQAAKTKENRIKPVLPFTLILLLSLLSQAVPRLGFAQEAGTSLTVRYFEQLRDRRLFSVAEQLGIERLADPLATPEEFIQFSVELSKTYAEHARYTSGEEHEQYWQFAESVLEDALAKHARHPRSLLLEVQRAFLPAERGEFLRGQLELFPFDQPLQKQTEQVFQSALERLKPMETKLAQQHRQWTLKRDRGPGELAAFEIHDLLNETRFRLAVTLQEFAKTKSNFTGERTTLLREAAAWLGTLSELPPGEPFKLPANIRLAENHRLRNDLSGADGVLKELEESPLPEEFEAPFMAERVRWLMAKGQLAEALARIEEFRTNSVKDTGELAFLNGQILFSQWESADKSSDESKAKPLARRIEALVKSLESRLGGYWGYRVSLLGEQLEQSQKYGSEVAGIVRRAEARYAAGESQASAADYLKASDLASQIGKPEVAFDLGYTQASILLNTKQIPKAAAVAAFHQLVNDFPKNERAPNAHLLEGYCLGKLYEEEATGVRREAYTNHLKAHIEKYPEHETAGDAYWMLGQLEEQRKQNTQALTYYRSVPAAHRLGLAAQLAVARCYEKVIERLHEFERAAEEPQRPAIQQRMREWEHAAAEELSRFIEAYPKEPEALNHAQADVALQLARLQLMRTVPDYARADSLLERILVSGNQQESKPISGNEQAEWPSILKTSRQLRIVSLAGQGLSSRAELLVRELSESSTQDVLGVMDGLVQIARRSDPATQRKLGQLQLQTANELNSRRHELDEAEQYRLDHCRAQAFLATNRPDEALKLYDQMLAREPKNKTLHLRIAGLLSETDHRACLARAKELWKLLEAGEKPGSVSWLEKRYEVARSSWKLGQTEECRKLLGVTKLLYPQRGNAELRAKYEQLEKELPRGGND